MQSTRNLVCKMTRVLIYGETASKPMLTSSLNKRRNRFGSTTPVRLVLSALLLVGALGMEECTLGKELGFEVLPDPREAKMWTSTESESGSAVSGSPEPDAPGLATDEGSDLSNLTGASKMSAGSAVSVDSDLTADSKVSADECRDGDLPLAVKYSSRNLTCQFCYPRRLHFRTMKALIRHKKKNHSYYCECGQHCTRKGRLGAHKKLMEDYGKTNHECTLVQCRANESCRRLVKDKDALHEHQKKAHKGQ